MTYIIIGNGAAGVYAAKKIREQDKTASIEIITEDRHHFYSRPRLPEYLSGKCPREKLTIFKEEWYKNNTIDVSLNTKITQIKASEKKVITANGDEKNYDKLLIATGSKALLLPIEGIKGANIYTIRSIEDVEKLKKVAGDSSSCIILGGGLLGLEIANAIKTNQIEVSVIEYFARLLPKQLDQESADILKNMLQDKGLTFHLDTTVQTISDEGNKKLFSTETDKKLLADFAIVSTGIQPETSLANETGITINKGIIIDDQMQTNIADIYAAGDCAEHNSRIYGLWSAAKEQGEAAALNMLGIQSPYHGTPISTSLKVAGIELASLGEFDVEKNPKLKEVKQIDQDTCIKLFLEDAILKGAILIGANKKVLKIKKLIAEQTPISNEKEIFNL